MTIAATLDDAALIPYVTSDEAERLGREELRRLLELVESLDEQDWHRPTACTLWSVRDMLAHQAGAYASGTGYRELVHQYMAAIPMLGGMSEDAVNRRQLADRADRSPAELIAELRETGDRAVANWAHRFRFFKLFGIPHPGPGWLSMRHLMLVIHSRDTWIHRLDICRATGRPFRQTAAHDGRIVALVVRDLAGSLARTLGGQAMALELTGPAGGAWRVGRGVPAATVRMDAVDFNIYASGRFTHDEAVGRATFTGDAELTQRAFRHFAVLY